MSITHLLMILLLLIIGMVSSAAPTAPFIKKPLLYVNNKIGSDKNDGLSAKKKGKSGPVASIMQAVRIAPVGAYISIANTGVDYRESVHIEDFHKGLAANPLVLDGNGATVTGLREVPAKSWIHDKDDIYYFEGQLSETLKLDMPNSNWLAFTSHEGWFTEPQAPKIFFVNGKSAPHTRSLETIPRGGFFYHTQGKRRVYFRLPAGEKLEDLHVDLPLNTGVYISDDYVTVRNMISRYSQDDGFYGFWGIGVVFENINGSDNCDQGFSMHGTSASIIDGGLFERNGGCGIADVMSCVSIFRNVTVRDNMFAGALFQGVAHTCLSCRFENNLGSQVSAGVGATINLVNCLINGKGNATGVNMEIGRLDHCTIVNCNTGLAVSKGGMMRNSIIANCGRDPLSFAGTAAANFSFTKTIISLGGTEAWDWFVTRVFGSTAAAQYLKQPNKPTELIADNPMLQEPLFLLPADSPYYKVGEFTTTPGANLPEYHGWSVTEKLGAPVPHP